MKILATNTGLDGIEVKDFTVIAYAGENTLGGDAAVHFREQPDGAIVVTDQRKPAGPWMRAQPMTEFVIQPWRA